MNNKAPNKHSDARSFEMRRLIFLGAAGVLILVVVILSLLSAFGGKSDGQSTGNGTSSAVTEDGKLVIQDLYEGEITIPKFNVPLNTYDQSKFKNDNGLVTYDDANASLGIDVSDYQGDIDWAAVKASGIDFAMIRAGYRGARWASTSSRRQLLLPKRRRKRAMCSSFCRINPSITPSCLTGSRRA